MISNKHQGHGIPGLALRAWYSRLSTKLKQLGFMASNVNTSLFIYSQQGVSMFLLVYVDDIIVTISSSAVVEALLKDVKNDFALKDLGDLHDFLGIQVKKDRDGTVLSQEKHVTELIE
jgi:hypothetical protein